MTPICTILLLLATPLLPQVGGGGLETHYQWDGGAAGDTFGFSVSGAGDVNGDGIADVIIGAPSAGSSGEACVYSGADGSLLFLFTGGLGGGRFGGSVSDAGDVNGDGIDDVVVGDSLFDQGGLIDSGAAYVYSGADGSLLYQWNGTLDVHRLGESVSGAGDVNGDGYADVLVGGFGHDTPSDEYSGKGDVMVYSGFDGSVLFRWVGQIHGDQFGYSVSTAGDVNGDGIPDVIVGAPGATLGVLPGAGAAFVFSGASGTIISQWGGQHIAGYFGHSVSGAGDVNQDGYYDLIIGDPDTGDWDQLGFAYVYSGFDSSLLFEWEGGTFQQFGTHVSAAGDMNGDGFDDLLMSTPWASLANVYSGENGSLIAQVTGSQSGSFFGISSSCLGDIDGDGLSDFVVGEILASPGGLFGAGSAYVYSFSPYLTSDTPTISASTGGTVTLALDFPDEAALHEYKVLISKTGSGPSFYGVDIPLTRDRFLNDAFLGSYPFPTYTDLHGTLDANGDAAADLTLPAGIPSSAIGQTYYLASIANPTGLLPEYSSVAVSLEITP